MAGVGTGPGKPGKQCLVLDQEDKPGKPGKRYWTRKKVIVDQENQENTNSF